MANLLNTLIFRHLEVFDHHVGPPPAGLGSDTLHDFSCYLGYRLGERVPGHDVDLQLLGSDDNP
jgi:hypothetical protein